MRRKLNVVTALLVALLCINSVTGSDLSVFADVFAATVQTEEQTYEDTAPSETAADFEDPSESDETTEQTDETEASESSESEPSDVVIPDETTEETEATEATEETEATEPSSTEETEAEVTAEPAETVETEAEPTAEPTKAAEVTATPTAEPTAAVTATPEPTEQVKVSTLEKTITASDGNNYKVKVTYDSTMGIPENAELSVFEIRPSDASYDEYVDKSAEVAGCESRVKDFVCAFDISITDKATGAHIEPTAAVKVEIRLLNDTFSEEADIKVVHFGDEVELVDSSAGKNTIAFETDGFSVFVVSGYTLEQFIEAGDGNTYKIKVTYDDSAALPSDVELLVREITANDPAFLSYRERSRMKLGLSSVDYIRLFDISIVNKNDHSVHYQPKSAVSVDIELVDGSDISREYEVVHFGTEPEQMDVTADGPKVSFETSGFSAYAIVQGSTNSLGYVKIKDLADLNDHLTLGNGKPRPFFIEHIDGCFFRNEQMNNVNNTAGRTGIYKTKPASKDNPPAGAAAYYFEYTGSGDKYYIYCFDSDGNKQYLCNNANNSISFVSSNTAENTKFTLSTFSENVFRFKGSTGACVNQQGSASGQAFAAYNNDNDNNAKLTILYTDDDNGDPYGIDGKSYVFAVCDSNSGVALQADEDENALTLPAVYAKDDRTDIVYIPMGTEVSEWTFEWQSSDRYYISTQVGGQKKYLRITSTGIEFSDSPAVVRYCPGTNGNSGKFMLESGGYAVKYSGKVSEGYVTDTASKGTYLSLAEPKELEDEYVVSYAAKKVSISDRTMVPDGAQVIIYTRIWNNTQKEYEFYAVDHDGSLFRVYERADEIQWVGSQINTLLWDFTEYHYENGTPNNYYELQNVYSEQYLAPQIQNDQVLSDSKIGINMSGRRDGNYYSEITAWDNKYYSYAGIKTEGTDQVISCPRTHAETFYFAVMNNAVNDELKTVDTLDNSEYGIKMKIVDFSEYKDNQTTYGVEPSVILEDYYGAVNAPPKIGLLYNDLDDDGYPVSTKTQRSFKELFDKSEAKTVNDLDVIDVNHLFIESTYEASGYYEFDSTQDYAVLQDDGNFKVYHQLGSNDTTGKASLKHGQFFPFNDLTEGYYCSTNSQNLFDALQQSLADDDPRKYEKLYRVANTNYFFGVELEAGFVQTPSGHDAWGHDIIYEFTGDDDFWLYVDGELVIDLGGLHSALSGKVNFCTGVIEVDINDNGKLVKKHKTTLREVFTMNYQARNPDASQEDIDAFLDKYFEPGENVFRDYSAHTMKIFYMERGAGASNLHMRFNLSSVKPGQILLSKEISGTDEFDFNLAEFAYQIYYQLDGSDQFVLLDDGTGGNLNVKYQNSSEEVKYKDVYNPKGTSEEYHNVFFISPGRPIAISVPDSTINYKIVECGVNPSIYDVVKVNDSTNGLTAQVNGSRLDYTLVEASVEQRPNVVFDNHVKDGAVRTLTVTKELYDATGTNRITDDPKTFDYRLYLAREDEETLKPADMVKYSVKNAANEYCRWEADVGFVSVGKTLYEDLTDEEKEQVTFESSPNGAISKIPVDHSIEVRNLLVGTHFKIEERKDEIPEGYQLIGYEREEGSFTFDDANAENSGYVRDNADPSIIIKNKRGWGLTVQKQWSDAEFTVSHDPVYVAIYNNGTLVPGSVRKLDEETNSTYYFFDDLASDAEFAQYESREVLLTGSFTVDADGNVSGYDTIKIIDEEPFKLNAIPLGSSESKEFSYIAEYEPGEATGSSADIKNVRTDVITNTRGGGIVMRLKDTEGNNLKDGIFTLSKIENGVAVPVGDAKYTTGKNGRITILYDFDYETDYILTQTASPRGYQGVPEPVTFRIAPDNSVTYVTDNVTGLVTVEEVLSTEDNLIAYITVINYPFTLQVIKTDRDTGETLQGAHFALYRQVKGVAGPVMDKNPLAGFEDIVSDGNGVIEGLDQTLAPRTYYLKETKAPLNYLGLDDTVILTIDSMGVVTISSAHPGTLTENKTTDPFGCDYTIEVTNEHEPGMFNLTVEKKVTGGDKTAQFGFTLDEVEGGNDGDQYDYIKTAVDGTETAGKISKSGTFTLAHDEHIVISFPENVTVTISEDHGEYETSWKVDGGDATVADNRTVVMDDDKTLSVTNHIDDDSIIPSPTGISTYKTPMILMLIGSMTVLCLVFIDRKRRKGKPKIRKVTKKMLKGVI